MLLCQAPNHYNSGDFGAASTMYGIRENLEDGAEKLQGQDESL
jgi:hypothetical protein